jgi:5S rRNA maturation endonuclease (ribonuclease M5)
MIQCPAHEDRNPSCSVNVAGGKLLLHCFSGCRQADVVAALKARGLWPEPERPHGPGRRASGTPARRIVATYDYTDEKGVLLYQICRTDPKDFLQRRPDGRGGWIWKKHPRQVLYHLPEVLEAAILFVTEGEKDAECLRSWGFCATTNAGGAKAPWLPEFTEALRGREVIIWPDNDPPGMQRGYRIAKALYGKVSRLLMISPDDVKDASEWFAQGHSEIELITKWIDGEGVPPSEKRIHSAS